MIRVVKVGGSLFDLVDLPTRLREWLSRQPPAHSVLIAGGGELVDVVRREHLLHPGDEITAHWRCVELMSETAKSLHRRLPEAAVVADVESLKRRAEGAGTTIFDAGHWLREFEPGLPGVRLPCTWETTSDSIAGRLAIALGADELVLLKSTLPLAGSAADPRQLAAAGYVDAMFTRLAPELPPTRFVDLRKGSFPEIRLAHFIGFASQRSTMDQSAAGRKPPVFG